MNLSVLTYLIASFLVQNSLQDANDFDIFSGFFTTEKRSLSSFWSKNPEKQEEDTEASTSTTKPKIENQLIPRLITNDERSKLLQWIKSNDQKSVVDFFNDPRNNNIDYPLIRFKDGDFHGYTPLAAAIRQCSQETAKALAPAQYQTRALWTADIAPGHSAIELTIKYCPLLLVEVIQHQIDHEKYEADRIHVDDGSTGTQVEVPESKPHVLDKMTHNPDHLRLATIFKYTLKHSKVGNLNNNEKDLILNWIAKQFNDDKVIITSLNNKQIKKDNANVAMNFEFFIDSCIKKNIDPSELVNFLSTKIHTISRAFFKKGMIQLFHSGKSNIFVEHSTSIPSENRDKLILQAVHSMKPAELDSFTQKELQNLQASLRLLDIQSASETLMSALNTFSDMLTDWVKGNGNVVQDTASGAESVVKFLMDPSRIIGVLRKNLNVIYDIILKQYPRVDFAVALAEKLGEGLKVYWTGSKELEIDFVEEIIEAYNEDNVDTLKTFLTILHENNNGPEIHFSDLRFDFAPYGLSPLKAAVMLNKPKILNFLLTDRTHRQSLFASTKFELSAIEMAACYHPQVVIDHILPAVGSKCKERLKMANYLIEMFSETKVQKCPTGAKNAPIIIPAILKSANTNSDEVKCINLTRKDLIEEAVKLRFPVELITAFHMTGLYKNTEYYLRMALQRGYLDLFKYFESQISNTIDSQELKDALPFWIRNTDGFMTEENIAMLEYLLSRNYIDVNSYGETGMTALSIATQRSFVWIMKRLLLVKGLQVNRIDIASQTPTLQHALNIFRNEPEHSEISKENVITRFIILLLAQFDISAGGFVLDQVRIFAESINKVDLKVSIQTLMGSPPDLPNGTWSTAAIRNRLLSNNSEESRPIIEQIFPFVEDRIKYLFDKLCSSSMDDWFYVIIEGISMIRDTLNIPIVQVVLSIFKINYTIVSTGLAVVEVLLNEGFNYIEKMAREDAIKALGRPSANYGLPHNLLLAHPDINPVLDNSSNLDSLHLSKYRAKCLKGDNIGYDEMARTHIRIRNTYPLHDGGKRTKNIVFGTITTIIVGAASAGIIRWML